MSNDEQVHLNDEMVCVCEVAALALVLPVNRD
jgi:hypothetical protein